MLMTSNWPGSGGEARILVTSGQVDQQALTINTAAGAGPDGPVDGRGGRVILADAAHKQHDSSQSRRSNDNQLSLFGRQ